MIEWSATRQRGAVLLALLIGAIAALPLLVGPGIVNTRAGGDSPFLLVRLHQLVSSLNVGVFPVRWMPDAAYGYGYPFFHYYAALPYYFAAGLKLLGLGYLWSIKLTQTFGFLAAAVAMYGLLWHASRSRAAALLGALAYTYAPFHLVNVYVRGDSLSEFYAFVFYPLIFWALLKLRESPTLEGAAGLALSYAGLILTHNVSALIFSPFIALYILGVFLSVGQRRWVRLVYSALGLLGGLAISAWFWWPALTERGLGHMADMTTGYFHYAGHFRGASTLVQPALLFDYAITAERNPFAMGLSQALAAAGAVLAILLSARSRRPSGWAFFSLATLALSTWLITPLSRPLWDHLPLLPMVQFPWRFLSVQAFAVALCVAHLPLSRPGWRWLAPLIGLLLLIAAMGKLRPERLYIYEAEVTAERLRFYELFTGNIGSTVRFEYLPQWVEPRPFASEAAISGVEKASPLNLAGTAASRLVAKRPGYEEWEVRAETGPAKLAFQTYYFPGWRAFVDGKPAPVTPLERLGYIQIEVPEGEHRVILRFQRTRRRALLEIGSLCALLATLAVLARRALRTKRGLCVLACLILMLAISHLLLRFTLPTAQMPSATDGLSDLTMDFARQPYLHHNPRGVDFQQASLMGYRLQRDRVSAGEEIELTLYWKTKAADLAAEVALVSLAEPLFSANDLLAESRLPIQMGASAHRLPVPQDTVPGVYLLRVRLWQGSEELRPLMEHGETFGTTYLQPVWVENRLRGPAPAHVLGEFGPCIALANAAARQQGDRLEVKLLWHARCQSVNNYAVSVRLKGEDGRILRAVDIQPHYGFYPTSFWKAGDLVPDRYWLDIPKGTPPGASYALEIVLYDRPTLQALSMVTVPGIILGEVPTEPSPSQGQ